MKIWGHRRGARPIARFGLVAVMMLVAGLLLGAGAASAQTTSTTPCPTDYGGTTVPGCTGPTTSTSTGACPTLPASPGSTPLVDLTVSFNQPTSAGGNDFTWGVAPLPPAAEGTTVQFFINKVAVTGSVGTATIQSDGCSSQPPGCLISGTYQTQAEIQGYPASQVETLVIPAGITCTAPVVPLAASTGTGTVSGTSSASSGPLAFTGANIFRALLVAALLILLGLVITHVARERRRVRR